MCKHILNAQVSILAPCCRQWFDCAECHAERAKHELLKREEMIFVCKKCRKVFRKVVSDYDEADEYCPHCDNHYVIEAKTPKPRIEFEAIDPRLSSNVFQDPRCKPKERVEAPSSDELAELERLCAED